MCRESCVLMEVMTPAERPPITRRRKSVSQASSLTVSSIEDGSDEEIPDVYNVGAKKRRVMSWGGAATKTSWETDHCPKTSHRSGADVSARRKSVSTFNSRILVHSMDALPEVRRSYSSLSDSENEIHEKSGVDGAPPLKACRNDSVDEFFFPEEDHPIALRTRQMVSARLHGSTQYLAVREGDILQSFPVSTNFVPFKGKEPIRWDTDISRLLLARDVLVLVFSAEPWNNHCVTMSQWLEKKRARAAEKYGHLPVKRASILFVSSSTRVEAQGTAVFKCFPEVAENVHVVHDVNGERADELGVTRLLKANERTSAVIDKSGIDKIKGSNANSNRNKDNNAVMMVVDSNRKVLLVESQLGRRVKGTAQSAVKRILHCVWDVVKIAPKEEQESTPDSSTRQVSLPPGMVAVSKDSFSKSMRELGGNSHSLPSACGDHLPRSPKFPVMARRTRSATGKMSRPFPLVRRNSGAFAAANGSIRDLSAIREDTREIQHEEERVFSHIPVEPADEDDEKEFGE